MFNINDMVMYGNSGVCQIIDIRPEKFGEKEILYYILKPADNDKSTIYCPVDNNKIQMRKLLTIEEIHDILKNMPDSQVEWIESDQLRKEKYTEILKNGSHQDLVKLIRTLHKNQEEKIKTGKKFHIADERIMREAEHKLHGEFAYVLNIKLDEVVPFIMRKLQQAGNIN